MSEWDELEEWAEPSPRRRRAGVVLLGVMLVPILSGVAVVVLAWLFGADVDVSPIVAALVVSAIVIALFAGSLRIVRRVLAGRAEADWLDDL